MPPHSASPHPGVLHVNGRLRNEEHSRLKQIRSQHAEEAASVARRQAGALSSLTRQCELDKEEWGRRAKEEASGSDEVTHLQYLTLALDR